MRATLKLLLVVLAIALVSNMTALADWVEEDGHKMHFPQLPNTEGWDVNATEPVVLAEDWMCSETGWVKDIHFWGSWRHGMTGQIIAFTLSIHEDIPADPPAIPYSRPGVTLWETEVTEFVIAIPQFAPGPEGWYDPSTGDIFPQGDHMEYFLYNVFLPEPDWFWQEGGRIYWLNISARVVDPVGTQWGWKSTLDRWNDDAVWGMWGILDWIEMYEPPDFTQSLNLSFVINGEPGDLDTCDYYKPRYPDYTPQGMPDFDMKQAGWTDLHGNWSHDGPAALGDCLWWFDSKFEPSPIDPRPFFPAAGHTPNDNYPLVQPYSATWDDHDTNNVQPYISDLATNYLNTNGSGMSGTTPFDMINGLNTYLTAHGLRQRYNDSTVLLPTYEYIQGQVLDCQDVILLLSFYEDHGADPPTFIGSHWVTVAGVCTDITMRQMCISDPYLDMLEGEPPAGSVHGGTIHNDANNISGPHGQIQHDPYQATQAQPVGWGQPIEILNYPTDGTMLANFAGMNNVMDWFPWGGGSVYTVIEMALVICPRAEVFDTVKCEPQGGQNPNHPPTYWYDVIPGDALGRFDFHVKVYDSVLANYSNFVEPAGWSHVLAKHGSDWWMSWCDPSGANPLMSAFRFQFDHNGSSAWSDWRTTNDGACNPYTGIVDSAEHHNGETNGYGYLVHAPLPPPPPRDVVVCEPQGVQNPTHPPTYWYDVTPSVTGRCDFHVLVYDSVLAHYSNWVEPTGWVHSLHKVGSDWWVSWYSPGCSNAIFTTTRFAFDNANPSLWSAWATTQSGTATPTNTVIDSSGNHVGEVDGYGYRVHVPQFDEELILKWDQPPQMTDIGMDVRATDPVVLADDFLCTSTGPIREIRVYGSWIDDVYPMGDPGWVAFRLSLHADIPQGPNGWSIPGELLWIKDYVPGEFGYELYFQGPEGWYDPETSQYIPVADFNCWEYIFRLDEEEFIQQGTEQNPIVYWLDVQAFVDETGPQFGWKTSEIQWNDDAVFGLGGDPPATPWFEMRYPPQHPLADQSINLAFRIFGQESQILGACCFPDTSCAQMTQAACIAAGGSYTTDGMPCTPNPCCCIPPYRGNVDNDPADIVSLG